jgi:hypothetical protein
MSKVNPKDVLRLEFQSIFSVDPGDEILLEMAREFSERSKGIGLELGLMGYTHCTQKALLRDESERAHHMATFKKYTHFARVASSDLFSFYEHPHTCAYMTFSESYWDREDKQEAWRFRCFVDFQERNLHPRQAIEHFREFYIPRLQHGMRFHTYEGLPVHFILRNNIHAPRYRVEEELPPLGVGPFVDVDLTTDEELDLTQ